MSNANDRQEGGNHYRTAGPLQHWDLAVLYQWDPFQYQITKYIMRWKTKHSTPEARLVDLKKARHFLDKYIEEAAAYDSNVPAPQVAVKADTHPDFTCEGYYGDGTELYKCRHCGTNLRTAGASAASEAHGSCAQPHGYLMQG
jgi:hypothetical protein